MTIKRDLILCILAGFCGSVLIVMKFAVLAIYLPDKVILWAMVSGLVALTFGFLKILKFIKNI